MPLVFTPAPFTFLHRTPVWAQFLLGLVVVGVAIAGRLALDPFLGDRLELITLWMVLVPLAWALRPAPYWASSIVGLLGTLFFIIGPRGTMAIWRLDVVLTIAMSLLIIGALWASATVARRAVDEAIRVQL